MILIIEDNNMLRITLEQILDLSGFEVITAKNGAEGYQIIMNNKIDVVLSDINMPILNGIQLLSKTKERLNSSDFPYWIFISANSDDTIKEEGLRLGANDFISKPYCHKHLLNILKEQIHR